MPISFDGIEVGSLWERRDLATLWNYQSFHAIARGVVTPRNRTLLILFITREKQSSATQYEDLLEGDILRIDGEKNRSSDGRIINAETVGDEIHLFYRQRHHSPFTYHGQLRLVEYDEYLDRPSRFTFRLVNEQHSS